MNSHVVDCPSAICAARCFPVHIRNISVPQRKSMFTKYITNFGTVKSILQSMVLYKVFYKVWYFTKNGAKHGTLQSMQCMHVATTYVCCIALSHLVLVSSCQVSALPLLLFVCYCL